MTKWILQDNGVDAMTAKVSWALWRQGNPPFAFSYRPGEALPDFGVSPEEAHFFYGSVGFIGALMREPKWAGSIFLEEDSLDQRRWIRERGSEMLNAEAIEVTLGELMASPPSGDFFARPMVAWKAFGGQVIHGGDFSPLFRGRKGEPRGQDGELLVAVSPLREIEAEFRFIVLDGAVRAGSRYKAGGKLSVGPEIDAGTLAAAADFARGPMPSELIVMDVCKMADGSHKIVEFNGAHGAGLYAIEPERFIGIAQEAMAARLAKRRALGAGAGQAPRPRGA